jgi:cell wall assembly regulator SMI1
MVNVRPEVLLTEVVGPVAECVLNEGETDAAVQHVLNELGREAAAGLEATWVVVDGNDVEEIGAHRLCSWWGVAIKGGVWRKQS